MSVTSASRRLNERPSHHRVVGRRGRTRRFRGSLVAHWRKWSPRATQGLPIRRDEPPTGSPRAVIDHPWGAHEPSCTAHEDGTHGSWARHGLALSPRGQPTGNNFPKISTTWFGRGESPPKSALWPSQLQRAFGSSNLWWVGRVIDGPHRD